MQGSSSKFTFYFSIFAIIIVIFFSVIIIGSTAPGGFPSGKIVKIEPNTTQDETAFLLKKEGVIRSVTLFKAYSLFFGGDRKIMAGTYLFDEPQSVLRVIWRTTNGDSGLDQIKITIPEGSNSKDIAKILENKIKGFDSALFLVLAKPYEGYLFPDTYFLYPDAKAKDVLDVLMDNFKRRIEPLEAEMKAFSRTPDEIIKMASILEREATNEKDRKIIAGILWKRMDEKMPLQVDAPFWYILGKGTSDLTMDDLAVNSPYNLYRNTGLPPTPISNPGIEAIKDAMNPVSTKYYYYLSDKEGEMHYASNLEGHAENRNKYLQ